MEAPDGAGGGLAWHERIGGREQPIRTSPISKGMHPLFPPNPHRFTEHSHGHADSGLNPKLANLNGPNTIRIPRRAAQWQKQAPGFPLTLSAPPKSVTPE